MRRGKMRALRIGVLLGIMVLAGCGPRTSVKKPTPKSDHATITAHLSDVHPSQLDENGNKLWEASARALTASEVQRTGQMEQVTVTLYQHGKPGIVLTAPQMKADYKLGSCIWWGREGGI